MATLAYLEGNFSDSSTVTSPELMVDHSGTIFKHSELSGGYHPIAHISDFGINNIDELRGLEGVEELDGTLGKGFKFKMPKMKMPKFKAPKFKAPKINTRGFSKGISGIGKGISKGISSASKAYSKHLSKIGEAVQAGVKGAGGLVESLMSQEEQPQPDEEQSQEEEQTQEEFSTESEEILDQDQEMQADNYDESLEGFTVGCQMDSDGKLYRYSPINQKLVELSGHELGFLSNIMSMASSGGSGGGGLLNMATTGLDMVVPGAGSIAKIGLSAAQKQKAQIKAKQAAKKKQQQALFQKFAKQKMATKPTPKPAIHRQAQIAQPVQRQIQTPTQSQNFQNDVNENLRTYSVKSENPTVRDAEIPKSNNNTLIIVAVGAGLLLIFMSSNKKTEKEK